MTFIRTNNILGPGTKISGIVLNDFLSEVLFAVDRPVFTVFSRICIVNLKLGLTDHNF